MAREYWLALGLIPPETSHGLRRRLLHGADFFGRRLSYHRPSRLSGQIVEPVLPPRRSLVATRMEFEGDAPVGPARFPWRAWLLAHGAAHPGEHVWSRNRRQREVWSRFLPSTWSSFWWRSMARGLAGPDRNRVNFGRQGPPFLARSRVRRDAARIFWGSKKSPVNQQRGSALNTKRQGRLTGAIVNLP